MKRYGYILLILSVLFACQSEEKKASSITKEKERSSDSIETENSSLEKNIKKDGKTLNFIADTTEVIRLFSDQGFDEKKYYDLLIETRMCDPEYSDTTPSVNTPCSARFFRFYPYNHNREIDDAFLLLVRAGVNGYPYRRLIIFTREKGKLVMMNGITGYLVKRISRPNKMDDLIVGIFDDLGDGAFERYDVLLRYNDGKYRFVEAIGDTQGEFKTEKLKKIASEQIHKRIQEKELIF